jgi:HK97 family phage major capsid protein
MSYFKSSKEIKAAIDDRQAEIDAVEALAREEKRDLNAEELKAANSWYGTDESDGEYHKLSAELETAAKREKIKQDIANRKDVVDSPRITQQRDIFSDVIVPRTARRHGRLKAFANEQEAFACGQFLSAVVLENNEAAEWCNNNGIDIRSALSTGDGSKGGFLVPEPMEASIIRLVEDRGVYRRFARPYPMTTAVDHHPRRESGVTVYFVGENEEVTASDPTVGDVELVAKTMAALVKISKRLNMTSIISIADWLTTEMAYGLADKEDEAGFNGDGTSTYGGISGWKTALAAGSIQDAASGNVSFATLDLADFRNAIGKVKHVTGADNAWYINKTGYELSMQRLKDAGGGNNNMNLAEGSDAMFLGYPVRFTQVLPSTDTVSTIQAYFGDLNISATLGTLQGISVESNSGGEYFKKLQVGVLGYQDVAINNHETGSASEAGTFVGLKTAAS